MRGREHQSDTQLRVDEEKDTRRMSVQDDTRQSMQRTLGLGVRRY